MSTVPLGAISIHVDNDQPQPIDAARWARLAGAALYTLGMPPTAEASLNFVSDSTIAELNKTYLGEEGPTDVVSFPIDGPELASRGGQPEDPDIPALVGDIFISPAQAARNAAGAGRPLDDELALLVVHGALHLVGYDHASADEEAVMHARERELLMLHYRRDPR